MSYLWNNRYMLLCFNLDWQEKEVDFVNEFSLMVWNYMKIKHLFEEDNEFLAN